MKLSPFAAALAAAFTGATFAQQASTGSKAPGRAPPEATSFLTENKLALIIGVNQYAEGSNLQTLKWAEKDAEDLAKALTDQGYKVDLLTGAKAIKTTIRYRLKNLAARVEPGKGTIVFAFSGHGAQAPDWKDAAGAAHEGEQYLLTAESSPDALQETALKFDEVQTVLKDSHAARKMMFIDACREPAEGSEADSGERSKAPPAAPTLRRLEAAEGIKILNSTAPRTRSYEEDTPIQHGIFTYFLLDALSGKAAGPEGLITFDRVANWVIDHVQDHRPAQKPYVSGAFSGDFPLAGSLLPEARRKALVVGIDKYQGGSHELIGAVQDARNMADALSKAAFWNIDLNPDLDSAVFRDKIAAFAKSLGPGDVALFYFAGSGAMKDGEAFMMAKDAKVREDALRVSTRGVDQNVDIEHSVKVSELLKNLSEGRSGPTLVILDMCLSRVGNQTTLNTGAWPKNNVFVLFSASPGQAASETAEGGIFTRALLPLLTEPGASTNDIVAKALAAVMDQSQNAQVPYPFPHLKEPFYFVSGQQ
jgi:uncharacterized caspase-like protein